MVFIEISFLIDVEHGVTSVFVACLHMHQHCCLRHFDPWSNQAQAEQRDCEKHLPITILCGVPMQAIRSLSTSNQAPVNSKQMSFLCLTKESQARLPAGIFISTCAVCASAFIYR